MKRLFKTTYVYRELGSWGMTREYNSGELCVAAPTITDAVERAKRAAKNLCKRDSVVFVRVRTLEDQGVIR